MKRKKRMKGETKGTQAERCKRTKHHVPINQKWNSKKNGTQNGRPEEADLKKQVSTVSNTFTTRLPNGAYPYPAVVAQYCA
jgi:hypothetical protein